MKKKIFMFALAACLIILSIAGSSMAYFTDVTEATTTTFTTGSVDIELSFTNLSTTKLFPGQEYACPAVITLAGDSEDAYVGAVITILGTSLDSVLVPESDEAIPAAIKAIFVGLEADGFTVKYNTIVGGYEIYVVQNAPLANSGANTTTIFSKVAIPAAWDHAQMNAFKTATVSVTAYATQTVGFKTGENGAEGDAVRALTTAFKNNGWGNYPA
ncbi:MAG: SipW-dependent-type signal peptide-containing protein [Clostridia bacterium]|nr:SipW-dependent-type signal peptide-containing protein [Clostridia bacterium]